MQLRSMLDLKMGWAQSAGPYHEVVLSSRLRLARNLKAHPFPRRASPKARAAVLEAALAASAKAPSFAKAARLRLEELEPLDRLFLVERHLISSLLAAEPKDRGLVVTEREVLSLMVNEEDHLRLQAIDSGLCLDRLLETALAADDELARVLDLAYDEEWGYLAACPTNAGTGLRASCLVHLPGLALTGQINRVLDGLARLRVVVRGLYGEGTRVMGDFYQIANATAMGPSEADLAANVGKVVGSLLQRELEARQDAIAGDGKLRLEDHVFRAMGVLANARVLSYEEAMHHLSAVRLALALGWRMPVAIDAVNELIVAAQPGHVQMAAGRELPAAERDALRAALVRKKFSS